jgi:hypothetical protein
LRLIIAKLITARPAAVSKHKELRMGVRGELFSSRVILPNRTYFFNVKENRMGDLYLNIVESKNRETGGFDRQSVILFADDLREFLKGFDESLRVLEKAVREKRRTGTSAETPNRTFIKPGSPAGGNESPRREKAGYRAKPVRREESPGSERPRKNRPPKERKRVVVRKDRE